MSFILNATDEEIYKSVLTNLSPEKLREFSTYILQKSLHLRTAKEKGIVQKYAIHVEFFKNVLEGEGSKKFIELCENLQYFYLPPGQMLFQAGSRGTTFYIILEGSVEVYLNLPAKDSSGKEILQPTKVSELVAGQSFGDIALMDNKAIRTATIVAKENCPCHFATLEREAYRRILNHLNKALDEQIEFLESVPFFRFVSWSGRSIQQWVKFFEKKVYPMNHVIYKEGDSCDNIYLVKSGDVRCLKTVEIRDKNANFLIDENNKLYPYETAVVTKQVELGALIKGQYFGEEEVLLLNYLNQREEAKKNKEDSSTKGGSWQTEIMQYIEDFVRETWLSKDKSSNYMDEDGISYYKNTRSKKNVTREQTMIVKSSKAEIWRISAKHFFLKIEGSPLAYQYLISKIDLTRKRRNERLPGLAKITPTTATYKGKRQHLIPSDETFLSIIKHKKYGKCQYEKVGAKDRSYIVDHKDNYKNKNHSFHIEDNSLDDSHVVEKSRNTSPDEHKNKLPSLVPPHEKHYSSNMDNHESTQKCLLLQKVNPAHDEVAKPSLETIIAIQTQFRNLHPARKKKTRPVYSFEPHKGTIHRISSRIIADSDRPFVGSLEAIEDLPHDNILIKEEDLSNHTLLTLNSISGILAPLSGPNKSNHIHPMLKKITQNAVQRRRENASTLNDSELSLFPTINQSIMAKFAGVRSNSIDPKGRSAHSPSKERILEKNEFLAQMLVRDERQPLIPKLIAKSTNTELLPASQRKKGLKIRGNLQNAIKVKGLQRLESNEQSETFPDTREKSFSFPTPLKQKPYRRNLSSIQY